MVGMSIEEDTQMMWTYDDSRHILGFNAVAEKLKRGDSGDSVILVLPI